MDMTYVEQRDGGYYVAGERVSLDSLVYAFRRGTSPESIRRSFPVLTLEQVYGAIAFYLAHEQEIDAYLKESERQAEAEGAEINAQSKGVTFYLVSSYFKKLTAFCSMFSRPWS
jgi:uncharacterized protein (DUF433 family)